MEETFLKLAASLGGFAGLAFGMVCWLIGKRQLQLEETIQKAIKKLSDSQDRHTRMELLRLAVSPHVSPAIKNQLKVQIEEVEEALKEKEKEK